MLRFILISIFILIVLYFYWKLRARVVYHYPKNYPRKNASTLAQASHKTIVVCVGDSLTHGNMGESYVPLLEGWLGKSHFFYNAGRNCDLTYTVLNRLEVVIRLQPKYITLLIGTNDINAILDSANLQTYYKIGRLSPGTRPSIDTFKANYEQIVERLMTETSAKIALLSIPVMSEDSSCAANQLADRYSHFVKILAREKGLTYLPVREVMKAFLLQNPKTIRHGFHKTRSLISISMVRHYLLGQSWNSIAQIHGNDLTHDNLHFTTRGAAIVATEVERFLTGESQPVFETEEANSQTSSL
ncbi:SGNH/GDSL hydrolase family protein [Arundinibacter roseus]|uniref:SGNH/GDSL hydrolase family protein n=1 Tax=Arundinibacter roseus TaxID=2070510 RepID=A0A4V2XAU6_9BACT|nr:SGNH/GDSL hydrolase family protein [Arundinibacter roseus]TDB68995.1 SGNH/GDSL hydrolase family protein [Arundinibacter roseus]